MPKSEPKTPSSVLLAFLDFGIYVGCVAGVFISRYLQDFSTPDKVELHWNWFELVIASVIAAGIMATIDAGGDKEGKRKNWWRRLSLSVFAGMGWAQMVAAA